MSDVYVKGLPELQKFLDQLPEKIERNILRGALRAGMNEVKPLAQSSVHSVSGELAKGLKVGTRRRGGIVRSNLKATGPHRSISHLVEFGTQAHEIKPRRFPSLFFAGLFRKIVMHPGARPKPFMRPALDARAHAATSAVAVYVKKRLTKEGLNVGHVVVEGDE